MEEANVQRNRELIAERLKWPAGALAECDRIERDHPGWRAYWTRNPWRIDHKVPDGPCFGASSQRKTAPGRSLFAASPLDLRLMINSVEDQWNAMHRHGYYAGA